VLIYWIMFLIPLGMVVISGKKRRSTFFPFFLVGLFFILVIGFRFDVGGDWGNYLRNFNNMQGMSLETALKQGDPGHRFLNWLSYQWNLGVYGTNVVYSIIFVIGLMKFSRAQVYPWIAVSVAVPYLVIVVAMGYSRQGVAIGLFLWAVTYLEKGYFKTYIGFILVAALFHKTAMLLLPLGIFLYGKGKVIRILMVIPIVYGSWDLLLEKEQATLWKNYVEDQMESQGAMIRLAMNLLPSLLFFRYKKEWKEYFDDYAFWFWIAVGSVGFVFLVSLASTAVDRMALYFIPIQLAVFSRLPFLARKQISPSVTKILIVILYTLVLLVWLMYATNARYWLPYQSILFQGVV